MEWINFYVSNPPFFVLSPFDAWARSIPGRAYAGIGDDIEVYDLSKTNGGDAYEELALRKD